MNTALPMFSRDPLGFQLPMHAGTHVNHEYPEPMKVTSNERNVDTPLRYASTGDMVSRQRFLEISLGQYTTYFQMVPGANGCEVWFQIAAIWVVNRNNGDLDKGHEVRVCGKDHLFSFSHFSIKYKKVPDSYLKTFILQVEPSAISHLAQSPISVLLSNSFIFFEASGLLIRCSSDAVTSSPVCLASTAT